MKNENGKDKMFWTLDEVRDQIYDGKVSKSTMFNMVRSGKIPSTRLVRRIFIPGWWVDRQIAIATQPGANGKR